MGRYADAQIRRCTDVQIHRYADAQMCRRADTQTHRCASLHAGSQIIMN